MTTAVHFEVDVHVDRIERGSIDAQFVAVGHDQRAWAASGLAPFRPSRFGLQVLGKRQEVLTEALQSIRTEQ